MANGYINQAAKQAICGIVGVSVFLKDLLAEGKLPNFKAIKRNLKAAIDNLEKVILGIMGVLDADVQDGLLRYTKNIDLICISRGDPRGTEPTHLVTEDEMLWLIQGHHDCLFCERKGHEITKCPLRRVALRCQLIPAGKGECPFWRDC